MPSSVRAVEDAGAEQTAQRLNQAIQPRDSGAVLPQSSGGSHRRLEGCAVSPGVFLGSLPPGASAAPALAALGEAAKLGAPASPIDAPRSPAPSSRSSGGARKRPRRPGPAGRSRRRRSGSEEWTPKHTEADAVSGPKAAIAGMSAAATANGSSGPEDSVDGTTAPSTAAGGANFQRGCGNPVVQVSRELKQSFDAHIADQLRQCTVSVTEGGPEHAPVLGRVLQLACQALRDMLDKNVVTAALVRTQFGEFQAVSPLRGCSSATGGCMPLE
jgi:hypothetical protein